ncbi:MAG: GNAT family N-acetyltransferase [Oscillospiraceae bacterium]|jgi:GNAT superfamily N-acetyltransferase|nr:GNAT family N-acetyltransferase [Oscillospiraceae bacterium]
MTDKQYINAIHNGHFLYWDMLGKLKGMNDHKENDLRWLTGEINYNYCCETTDTKTVVERMKNDEIPNNLLFFIEHCKANTIDSFKATNLFKEIMNTTGMAHELMDTALPKPDKRLNLFRVRELTQLKMAGSILNTVFDYRLFSYDHFIEMMENNGQYFYMAEYDGLPVGACMAQHGDSFVNISWVGVLPGYRKLGIAGHLIQMSEQHGLQCGKSIGVLHGFPDAVSAYRRIGYRDYCATVVLELI